MLSGASNLFKNKPKLPEGSCKHHVRQPDHAQSFVEWISLRNVHTKKKTGSDFMNIHLLLHGKSMFKAIWGSPTRWYGSRVGVGVQTLWIKPLPWTDEDLSLGPQNPLKAHHGSMHFLILMLLWWGGRQSQQNSRMLMGQLIYCTQRQTAKRPFLKKGGRWNFEVVLWLPYVLCHECVPHMHTERLKTI